ncbi:hypothetical protein KEM56_002601 [Ascosphaera pollenicola]|nr:hypothetical protein KEM56_002601 [Ascosphaera pollenicola]
MESASLTQVPRVYTTCNAGFAPGHHFTRGILSLTMQCAPLKQAHIHARNALAETERSNPVAASEEHDLAAAEFASAAENCNDAQALRILRLLEQHHKRLAEVIKFQHEHRTINPRQDDIPRSSVSVSSDPPAKAPTSGFNDTPSIPPPTANIRGHSRLGRSIASDLASARGIRRENTAPTRINERNAEIHQVKRSASTSQKPLTSHDTTHAVQPSRPKPSWAPTLEPPGVSSHTPKPVRTWREGSAKVGNEKASADDPFNRFYSTFEGLISKISAPLAFAGLPLGNESKDSPSGGQSPASGDSSYHSHDPDLNKLLSPAAVRAIVDGNGSKFPALNPMESFYVVPTSGGTISYAGIVAGKAKQPPPGHNVDTESIDAQLESDVNDIEAAFQTVDLTAAHVGTGLVKNQKTLEELQLENETLKKTSDDLARQLQMWQANSQSSTLALHQSFRAMQHNQMPTTGPVPHAHKPPTSLMSPVETGSDSSSAAARIKDLERWLQSERENYDKARRENEKLNRLVERYRDRWEKLKAGARSRREAGQDPEKDAPRPRSGLMDMVPEEGSQDLNDLSVHAN